MVASETGWACFKVIGPLDFGLTGISLMALSTFDTDHLLVKSHRLHQAVEALKAGGCRFP